MVVRKRRRRKVKKRAVRRKTRKAKKVRKMSRAKRGKRRMANKRQARKVSITKKYIRKRTTKRETGKKLKTSIARYTTLLVIFILFGIYLVSLGGQTPTAFASLSDEFDSSFSGVKTNVDWVINHLELTTGQTSGTYESNIKDAGVRAYWGSMTWTENVPTYTDWFNSAWKNRKKLTITHQGGGTLTDYQMKVNIPFSAGMKSDYSDARFTKSDGTTLVDYFIDKDNGIAWVKIDGSFSSGSKEFYMYYGNSGASDASSYLNIFFNINNIGDSAKDHGEYAAITLDDLDVPFGSFYDATHHDLYVYNLESGNREFIYNPMSIYVGSHSSIGVRSSGGGIVVSHYNANEQRLEVYDTAGTSSVVVDGSGCGAGGRTTGCSSSSDVGKYSAITVDSSDYPHVVYYDSTNNAVKYAKCTKFKSTYDHACDHWVIETVADAPVYSGSKSYSPLSIAVDSAKNPHIVYYSTSIIYAKKEGGVWLKENLVSSYSQAYSYLTSDIALDSSDNPHIVFGGNDVVSPVLFYGKKVGSSWSTSELQSGLTGEASIDIDSSNNPHVVYYGASKLRYKYLESGEWVSQIIGSNSNKGKYNDVAVGSDDNVHIVYYDSAGKDFYYSPLREIANPLPSDSFGNVQYGDDTSSLDVYVRSCSSSSCSGVSWTGPVASGTLTLDNLRYFQYKVEFATTDTSGNYNPEFGPATIDYTPISGCLDDSYCSGDLPKCDTSSSACVACLNDISCGTATPYCANNACVECSVTSDCTGLGEECINNACIPAECTSNSQCVGNSDGEVCDTSVFECVKCLSTADCTNGGSCNEATNTCNDPVCTPPSDGCSGMTSYCKESVPNECVECITDADRGLDGDSQCVSILGPGSTCTGNECTFEQECNGVSKTCVGNPIGEVCNLDSFSCVKCTKNSECTIEEEVCDGNVCIVPPNCESNDDCQVSGLTGSLLYCDVAADSCVECLSDGQCVDGVCDENSCIDCRVDADCEGNAKGSVCEQDTCVECRGDNQCSANEDYKYCSSEAYSCMACLTDDNCASGVCEINACVDCRSDTDCTEEGNKCVANVCTAPECTVDSQCSTGEKCIDLVCGQCSADADCAAGQTCSNLVCAGTKISEVDDVIQRAIDAISVALSLNKDVSAANELLNEALAKKETGDLETAKFKALLAVSSAEHAPAIDIGTVNGDQGTAANKGQTQLVILNTHLVIATAIGDDLDVAEAQALLESAQTAFDQGNYDLALSLAEEAANSIDTVGPPDLSVEPPQKEEELLPVSLIVGIVLLLVLAAVIWFATKKKQKPFSEHDSDRPQIERHPEY